MFEKKSNGNSPLGVFSCETCLHTTHDYGFYHVSVPIFKMSFIFLFFQPTVSQLSIWLPLGKFPFMFEKKSNGNSPLRVFYCKTQGTDNLRTYLKMILPPDAKTTFRFSKNSQRKISVTPSSAGYQ